MEAQRDELVNILRTNQSFFIQGIVAELHQHGGPSYQNLPIETVTAATTSMYANWIAALESNDNSAILAFGYRMAQARLQSNIAIDEVLYVFKTFRGMFWQAFNLMRPHGDEHTRLIELVEGWFNALLFSLIRAYSEFITANQTLMEERNQLLTNQSQLIRELSTPLIPIFEGILVLPLVGAVDSHRATAVMEAALAAVAEQHAEVLLLDITGVPLVDTGVANYLIQLARAVSLLGAEVVLVGIGVEIAQTIVQLGVNLSNITTRSNLQVGVKYALSRRGLAVQASVR